MTHMDASPTNRTWTVPNLLSAGRIAVTPLLVWLIVEDRRVAAAVLVGVMGITDFLDGYIARHTGTVSRLGVLLDPVSDRIAVMAALLTLLAVGSLPLWLGGPVVVRDALLSIVFLVLARAGFGNPRVRFVGKAATFLILTSLPALVLAGRAAGDSLLRVAGLAVFAVGGALYFVAAAAYVTDIRAWLGERRRA